MRLQARRGLPGPVLAESEKIIGAFPLCDSCLGRLYAKRLRLASSRRLGSRIRAQTGHEEPAKCYICRGLLSRLGSYVDQLVSISEKTHYASFLVGTILRPSILDRDDLVRSRFKMRGADGIKTEVTRSLSRSFARRSKKPVDHLDPDLTLLVNFRTDVCERRARPLVISGRYTKDRRGLPQKQRPCDDCRGRGCIFCGNHGITGFDSVEGIVSRMLYERFDAPRVRFTWIGGEDKDSLVGGRGRPFFAKLVNPGLRYSRLARTVRLDGVSLHDLKRAERIPDGPVRFRSRVTLHAQSDARIGSRQLSRLRALTREPVVLHDGDRHAEKRIYEIAYKKTSPDGFSVTMLADGGLSMKRLVEGGGVTPSMSEILGTSCTCTRFDFEDIMAGGALAGRGDPGGASRA